MSTPDTDPRELTAQEIVDRATGKTSDVDDIVNTALDR